METFCLSQTKDSIKFSQIVKAIGKVRVYEQSSKESKEPEEITGIAYDSRRVQPGFLFVAVRGTSSDGRQFIGSAMDKGAVAVLGDDLEDFVRPNAVFLEVDNVRLAMAHAAATFYGKPSKHLDLVGITGTNGKTTTAYLVRSVFESAGIRSGLLGTIEYITGAEKEPGAAPLSVPAVRTTPESVDLQRYLHEMVKNDLKAAVMEVSSHALSLKRIHGCTYRAAVFTNLTRDHLDFHKTMDKYFDVKRELFSHLQKDGFAVLNTDDEYGRKLKDSLPAKTISYGINAPADIRALDIKNGVSSVSFKILYRGRLYRVESGLIGYHNIYNMLAAFGVSVGFGISADTTLKGLSCIQGVPGRFERVEAGQDFLVLVDYAHTDDALSRAIRSARSLTRQGRVITVFGCGGDRDKGKRSKMGRVASWLSDYVILTTDNPRSEEINNIFGEIRTGISRYNYLVIPERERAIRHAVMITSPGDVVLIAGKGHENYQEIYGSRLPFSDRDAAVEAIKILQGVKDK